MVSKKAVLVVCLILSLGSHANALLPTVCEPGQAATITGKILSVVARDTAWSIWLKRTSTDCSIAAVVVHGETLAPACKPGSRVTATGTIDADTLKSDPRSVMCAP
jgi:hypothetical protein